MSSIDGMARIARDNLQSSIQVTHSLTANPQSAPDYLMHRMNGVLRAIIDSNFDSASLQEVGELYAAIGEVQPQMMDTARNLALVNFSRSFAVVMENSIRAREGSYNNNNNGAVSEWNNNYNNNWPDSEWNNNNNNIINNNSNGFQGWASRAASWMVPVAGSGVAYGAWESGGDAFAPVFADAGGLNGFGPSELYVNGFGGVPSPAAVSHSVDPFAAAAERAKRAEKNAKKDYSPEAREGRITVFKIPPTVTELQLKAHFQQIGDIKEFSYPWGKGGIRKGFALIKFESNEVADAACEQLNGRELGGAPLSVERAMHWFKKEEALSEIRESPTFGTLDKKESGTATAGTASSGSTIFSTISQSTFIVDAPESFASDEDDVFSEHPSEEGENDPGIE